jgi:hypothetical protein
MRVRLNYKSPFTARLLHRDARAAYLIPAMRHRAAAALLSRPCYLPL